MKWEFTQSPRILATGSLVSHWQLHNINLAFFLYCNSSSEFAYFNSFKSRPRSSESFRKDQIYAAAWLQSWASSYSWNICKMSFLLASVISLWPSKMLAHSPQGKALTWLDTMFFASRGKAGKVNGSSRRNKSPRSQDLRVARYAFGVYHRCHSTYSKSKKANLAILKGSFSRRPPSHWVRQAVKTWRTNQGSIQSKRTQSKQWVRSYLSRN